MGTVLAVIHTLALICVLAPFPHPLAFGQAFLKISSSPLPVGSGARALGMGGAFIGVADDATAASWNPGGLAQLSTPEVSAVYGGIHRIEKNHFEDNPEASGTARITEPDLNYLSAVYPFHLADRNMILSLSYQFLYDFTREWDFAIQFPAFTDPFAGMIQTRGDIRYRQKGTLSALGLACCIQIIPEFSLGVTLNAWDDHLTPNSWNSYQKSTMTTAVGSFSQASEYLYEDHYTFKGYNANIGLLWRMKNGVTLGCVVKTPFTADITHENRSALSAADPLLAAGEPAAVNVYEEKMDMPLSWGMGISRRFSDRFTLSADFYRTEWQDLTMTDAAGREISPVTGASADESDVDPTHQIRLGGEYLFMNAEADHVIPVRFGLFYDPAPSRGRPDDFYGISLGSGFAAGPVIFDMTGQFRYGNDVGGSLIEDYGFSQDVTEYMLYSSLIFHF